MAVARKCDRCGKYYMDNTRYIIFGEPLVGMRFVRSGCESDRFYLCDNCLHELRKFMGIRTIKEEEEDR